jgi:hypothetical protein
MTVEKRGEQWWIVLPTGEPIGPFSTNADAWRYIDRQEGSPISKGEDTAEWISKKSIEP